MREQHETNNDQIQVAGLVAPWIHKGDYKESNMQRIEILARQAVEKGAQILVTSECFLDGYAREVSDRSIHEPEAARCELLDSSQYVVKFKALSKELGVVIIAGMAIREPGNPSRDGQIYHYQHQAIPEGQRLYNSAQVYSPEGQLVGIYRKTHGAYTQTKWHAKLRSSEKQRCFPAFDTPFGKVGLMICNDRLFPHTYENLVLNGAQALFCVSGGGYDWDIMAKYASEAGLAGIFVHPEGCAIFDNTGRTTVEQHGERRTLLPAELGSSIDKTFVVCGKIKFKRDNCTQKKLEKSTFSN